MKNRSQQLINKHLSNVNEFRKIMGSYYSLEHFSEELNELIQQVNNHVKAQNGKVEDIVSPIDSKQDIILAIRLKKRMIDNYRKISTFNQKITEEENSIHRIERKSYIRALVFRTLTTLSIGLGILFIYWLAQHYGINLPLMRVGA